MANKQAAAPAVHRRVVQLHGQPIAYRESGTGPVLLLIHGLAEAGWVWEKVIPRLARHFRVIAPDLLGHGRSAKPRGDYSLGSQASMLRDLLVMLDIDAATLVGHSLGGGIALQFAYQYPERCKRLVLIASGGLGRDVTFLLRSLGLPGAELVAPLVLSALVRDRLLRTGVWLRRRGFRPWPAQAAMWRSYVSLTEPTTRAAFIATVRAVIDQRGQRVSALERLYLARTVPAMILWGERDRIIPVDHAHAAHEHMPGSRLEIVPKAGHFVMLERPETVAALIEDFVATTAPARLSAKELRAAVLAGPPPRPPVRRSGAAAARLPQSKTG